MNKKLLHIVLFFCIIQQLYSQEDGVVSFDIPVRNSLKFNKYIINPAFSFVREQNKYISLYNKKQWVEFNDAPQTYLFSYAGRFKENIGAGVGLFQQNYGVLTTFGGVLNFSYNAVFNNDSNLTFGMNLGYFQSGINQGSVVTNSPDPYLENIPTNSLITVNPGINYGTTFFDFGISINNLVLYNLKTSKLIEDNPQQSIQGHIMYTGYLDSRGFFDESKFTGLIKSEFSKNKTIISGLMMLTIPKGIWAQAGYNTLYGLSGGIGLNISKQISIEYNFEKAMGELSTFGNSHGIALAYKFKNDHRYNYSGDDDEAALILPANKTKRVIVKRSTAPKLDAEAKKIARAEAKARIEARKQVALAKAEERKLAAATKTKTEEDIRIKLEEETKANKGDEVARLKLEADAKKAKADEIARLNIEADTRKAKADEVVRLKLEADAKKAKADEVAKLKLEADTRKAKADEVVRLKLEADTRKAKVDEVARLKLESDTKKAREEELRIKQQELDEVVIPVPTDEATKIMSGIAKLTTDSKIEQQNLLIRLKEKVETKEQDLKDLKEENDLSEKGIYKAPKAFKSVTEENRIVEGLKLEIDNIIKSQNLKLTELENLYKERLKEVPSKQDKSNKFYLNKIKELKLEQQEASHSKAQLVSKLNDIKDATDFERKRRIKRAAYDNEEDRYIKDRATLNQIKQNTAISSVSLKVEDFDFGEEQSGNIQIVKDVKNVDNGYYLVVAVHSEIEKRDEFLKKVISAGQTNVNFFYDVNTSKYYIYYEKFDYIEYANKAIQSNVNKPYNSKRAMVKIEN